jgi:hypothetical protein
MRKQAINYVKEELSTIDALLSKTHGQTDDINENINKLQKGLQGLIA